MKAAVMYSPDAIPEYTDTDSPIPQNDGELMMTVKAAALKHIDRSIASGRHYSVVDKAHARVIGGDGVGLLADGSRVFAMGVSGMMAEQAVIHTDRMVQLPQGIDDVTAAALPNAVAGSAMALRFRSDIQAGDTVLINGATGFTGKIAVQLAKHYGAGKVIVTGRNAASLQGLTALGADDLVSTTQPDASFTGQLKAIHDSSPIDIVLDYLWGHTAELILGCLKGSGSFTHRTRFVSIGAMTGDLISVSAENLRSVDLTLTGSGLGSWTKAQVKLLFSEIIPEAFGLAAASKLQVDTVSILLKDIAQAWEMNLLPGTRVVVLI